jgi:hypothetical protein
LADNGVAFCKYSAPELLLQVIKTSAINCKFFFVLLAASWDLETMVPQSILFCQNFFHV